MKKYIIYLAALFAFAGCQNDIEELNITLPSQHSLTVSLPTVDDSTRIEFADGESSISLNWEQGDTFTIYDSSGSKVDDYECSASSDSSSAIFTALSGVNQLLDGDSYTAIFPAVEDVITLDDHRTALAARISEQTQVGNNSTNHLNDALRMEAQFTYSGDSATQVTFAHTLATMRITFALEGGAIPTAFEFYDGDYESYTINMNDISTSNSYTAYYVINPNEGGERTLIFIITTATAEMQLFSVISSVTYSVGQSYVASVPGLTTVEIPDDYTPIYSVLDLNNVRNNLSGNYILMNDLNLSSYDNWAPIGSSEESSFSGIFDGGGHTVTGLTINSTDYYQGLFGYVNCGSISNLIIKDAQVIGDCYVGAVCGWLYGGTIAACSVEGGSVSASNSVGGVVGCAYNNSSITNCYNIGSVSGEDWVGGVVGCAYNNSSITNCYNMGSVSGVSSVGGVVGHASSVTACYNTGSISSIANSVGGVVGYASSSVTACYNTGSILGSSYVGGVVGYSTNYSSSSITACYNTGAVDGNGDNYYAGGVAGYASSYLYGCYYLPYSDMSYTSSTDGTADENLVATMTSSDFPATLNEAAGDDYFEFDSYNYNGGYPILISIDYSAIGD